MIQGLFVTGAPLNVKVWKIGMAMRLRQMRNDADNAHICGNMRESRIFANICENADMRIDSH